MNKHFLADYPSPRELMEKMNKDNIPEFREANGHIHTPYSFSAFSDMDTIFAMAREEQLTVLGINDFFVADGFEAFYTRSLKNRIFPLFNIEFIGLLKKEQKNRIRINDPNNPGRIYFSGKGLDYPFNPGFLEKLRLKSFIRESQYQVKEMIENLNRLIEPINPSIKLSYDVIKDKYARDIVRERHLAKAVRFAAEENYRSDEERIRFLESVYGNKKSNAGISNSALLENEIRSNLLKSGGSAFVREDESSFMELGRIIKIILKAGGIPCYPVLLDDTSGNYTEYENDKDKLHKSLSQYGIGCIELIPNRNDLKILREFIDYFNEKDYLIILGTEHNTPEMIPLAVTTRGSIPLDDKIKRIAWESVCVIAAHQYLRAKGMQGYILPDGSPSTGQKKELSLLGKLIIEFFLSNHR